MTDPSQPGPCPFRHDDVARGPYVQVDDVEFDVAFVGCGDCGASGPYVDLSDFPDHDAARAAAIAKWNERIGAVQ